MGAGYRCRADWSMADHGNLVKRCDPGARIKMRRRRAIS